MPLVVSLPEVVPPFEAPPLVEPLAPVPDVDDEPEVVFVGVVELLVEPLMVLGLAGVPVVDAGGEGVTVVILVAAALLPAPALLAGASSLPPPQAASNMTSAATGVSFRAVMGKCFHTVPLALPARLMTVG